MIMQDYMLKEIYEQPLFLSNLLFSSKEDVCVDGSYYTIRQSEIKKIGESK